MCPWGHKLPHPGLLASASWKEEALQQWRISLQSSCAPGCGCSPQGAVAAALTWIVDLTSGGPLLPLPEGPRDDGVRDICPVPTCRRTDSTGSACRCWGWLGSPGLSHGAALWGEGCQPWGLDTLRNTAGSGTQAACVTSHIPTAWAAQCP